MMLIPNTHNIKNSVDFSEEFAMGFQNRIETLALGFGA